MKRRAVSLFSVQQITAVIAAALLMPCAVRADDHVLPLSELHGAVAQASADRQANRAAIDHFFSEPRVESTLRNVGLNVNQLRQSAALLSDEEQAQLASRVRSAQQEIAGGELKDSQITLIILAVAAFAFLAVLVLAFK